MGIKEWRYNGITICVVFSRGKEVTFQKNPRGNIDIFIILIEVAYAIRSVRELFSRIL